MAKNKKSRSARIIHLLPDDILARILSLLRPKLRLLLVCKRWCRVACDLCPAWWRSVHVRGFMTDGLEVQKECEEKRCHPANSAELIGQRSTRAGFKRVARHLCQLHSNCDQLHLSCDPEDLALLIPRLLYVAAKHSPQLEGVELAVPLTPSPFSKALQTLSGKQSLRKLEVQLESEGGYPSSRPTYLAPLSGLTQLHSLALELEEDHPSLGDYLLPLSALTQLRSLNLTLEYFKRALPTTLLSRLQHLTHLGLSLRGRGYKLPHRACWGCGAPSSPRLRSLQLRNAWLPPEEVTIASLGRLESLRLQRRCLVANALTAAVPSLPGLTLLELGDTFLGDHDLLENGLGREWCLQLIAGCSQLRRLELHGEDLVEMDLPPGALQQLSYLSVENIKLEHLALPPSWAFLPLLEGMRLAGKRLDGLQTPKKGLGVLKDLDVSATAFKWDIVKLRLPHLTGLAMNELGLKAGLPQKRLLRGLRHLSIGPCGSEIYECDGDDDDDDDDEDDIGGIDFNNVGDDLNFVKVYNAWLVGDDDKCSDDDDSGGSGAAKLPSSLAQATSLEVLDLRGCHCLELQEADAALLQQLKRLRCLQVTSRQGLTAIKHLRMQLPEVEVDW